MSYDEFSSAVSEFFRSHGLSWAQEETQRTLDQGVPDLKSNTRFGMKAEVAKQKYDSSFFHQATDYTTAFERRGAQAPVPTTRSYTPEEKAQVYATALYSVLVEPTQLAKHGLELLQTDNPVVFASEDGNERLDVREAASQKFELAEDLQHLLEAVVKNAVA